MSRIRFLPPSDFLLEGIAMDIDPADEKELTYVAGSDLVEALAVSREDSFECYVAVMDDRPVAIFGLALGGPDGTIGVPWAIFTNRMREFPRELVATSRKIVERWSRMFPFLSNFVWAENTRAIRWLESLGFTMQESTGEGEMNFLRFEMRNV